MKKIIIIILLIVTLSCSFLEPNEEVLYLKDGDIYLPIYTRGNPNSENYIIWTHGGPGSSGMYYGDIEEIMPLQDNYRIIYWDQMSSGASTGNPSKDDFTVEKFSAHLDGVVKIVERRYHPKNLYLLGHSWGGYLASFYVADKLENQDHFNGLILLNPILNIKRSLLESISYIKDTYAPKQIEEGVRVEYWGKAIDWYNDNLVDGKLYGKNIAKHYDYIEEAGGMLIQRDRNDELVSRLSVKMALMSPFHFYNYYTNQNNIRTYLEIEDANLENNSPQTQHLENITLPVILIAGKDDKIAFKEMSEDWFSMFGTIPDNRRLRLYENCGHASFLDQPDQYVSDIKEFIYRY